MGTFNSAPFECMLRTVHLTSELLMPVKIAAPFRTRWRRWISSSFSAIAGFVLANLSPRIGMWSTGMDE
ncbi:hypothetical protein ACVOMV_11345 [Mesorhizobium atlanticum]